MTRRIVILEYDDPVRESIERTLEKGGYQVHGAVTGVSGLELIEEVEPDLVVLDPLLPALSGLAVIDVLKAKESDIPILVITSEANIVDNLAHQGIAGLLVKPVDPDKLLMHVDAILKLKDASGRMREPVERVWEREHRQFDEDSLTPPPKLAPAASEEAQAQPQKQPARKRSGRKPLVLVVEDEEDMLNSLSDLLEYSGYEVLKSVDGQDALAQMKKTTPNALVLDVMLPKMDGYQVCRMLKYNDQYRHIPVVMITARQSGQEREIAMAAGADAFLKKPFTNEDLIEALSQALKNAGYMMESSQDS